MIPVPAAAAGNTSAVAGSLAQKPRSRCGAARPSDARLHAGAQLRPGDIAALVALANTGQHSAAERGARGLLSKHPRAGILVKILSVALLRQGKAALPELGEAALLLPDDAEAQGNLGAALCDLGR